MEIVPTQIEDVLIIKPNIITDKRGYFFESFHKELLNKKVGREVVFCQENESKSSFGVLRGLHFQKPPFTQSKLVKVIYGEVLDVVVDLRKNSKTFGKYLTQILNDENKYQLFIPRGFAHGFVVLSDEAIFSYKVDNYYEPTSEDGLMFDSLDIDWILKKDKLVISEKDMLNKSFKDVYKFNGELYD